MKRATDLAPKGAESVAEQVRNAILEGSFEDVPWTKPWDAASMALNQPFNGKSGRPYRGWANQLTLFFSSHRKGFGSPKWVTYKQASDAGAPVRKGEKASPVEFWMPQFQVERGGKVQWLEASKLKAGEREKALDQRLVCRTYLVFNENQLQEPLPVSGNEPEPIAPWSNSEAVEALEKAAKEIGVEVQRGAGGDQAYYENHSHSIRLPRDGAFHSEGFFVSTFAHELIHATKRRTGRKSPFDEGYDRNVEEVIAEAGSWMLAVETGLPHAPQENALTYLSAWGQVLKEDLKELDKALSQAQKAARLLAGAIQEATSSSEATA